jgi:flavin-dependent dehydrogenase
MKANAYDVIIVGGGPGGSVAATWLAQKGMKVAVFEREPYPRFHIGESLLPASMPIFKEIGFYPKLDSGKYIRKYGARFIDYRTDEEVYFGFGDGLNREIPMAFEVPRAEFDRDLLDHARESGADIFQPVKVSTVDLKSDGVSVTTDQGDYHADYLLDVSGRDSLVGKKLQMRTTNKALNNVAVFSHYENVQRYAGRDEGDITIGLLPHRAWTWIIPFQGKITSVGIVASSAHFDGQGDLAGYLEKNLKGSGRVEKIMKTATRTNEPIAIGNYSHTCEKFFGERWILAGDAALFLDPIFSSGVHMSISSSRLAAEAIFKSKSNGKNLDQDATGTTYELQVRKGASRFYNLISMFYEGQFVEQMKKTLQRENMRKGFTSVVAGDVWNEDNYLFQKNVL